MTAAFAALTGLLLVMAANARTLSPLQTRLLGGAPTLAAMDATHSMNVAACPGYALTGQQTTATGMTAQLDLAGPACNAFGTDFSNLTVEVTYESQTRLHVNIFDSGNANFVVPESVVARPAPPTSGEFVNSSDLVFNFEPSPFAFWITRRDEADGVPLFDTRQASLPSTPIAPVFPGDNSTALDGFPLVFEDQYLQLTSALPKGANIYGLGEVVASSGIRRDVGTDGNGTLQTMWARDVADPIDANMYGVHPFYLEHRFNETTQTSKSHGVFHMSAAGSDILLATPSNSNVSLIEYRQIGGVLDFYFVSGPTTKEVVEQYSEIVGLPTWQPYWGFGFHLCRWGYLDVNETKAQVTAMREANIPLEVMWNDINLYLAVRDFTSDPVSFPGDQVRAFIEELHSNHQRYIPIVDAAVAHQVNATDLYDPYIKGAELDVFVKNPDGSEYIGQVWPGFTVFPDWFANNTLAWWTEALQNWSNGGVEFSGIWLDMNEASSFCEGSCGSSANLSNTSTPFLLPGAPGNPVVGFPECYDVDKFGMSGNITVNGTLTCNPADASIAGLHKRAAPSGTSSGAGGETGVDLNNPPYAIHNGAGRLSVNTIATNATHADGLVDLDTHNLFGMMEEITTHKALLEILPGMRPFIIARSTFAGAGKWTGHWLGDNFSLWSYMHYAIQGVLQFQMFQIPMVGPDTCGFNDNTDEELCNRWMQLSAFFPFYRNHNTEGAISQEPYRWDSVTNASRTAIAVRYAMLPYWYSLFANASTRGTPPVRPLFFEFENEPELFAIDQQFLIGRDILVTPVLQPNVSSVTGVLPGRGATTWRDWYTHQVVNATGGSTTADGSVTLDAPLGHINVHVRDGAALLLHAAPAYTTNETREGPYELLVVQAADGFAMGEAYVDDGVSLQPTPNTTVKFAAKTGEVAITASGSFEIAQRLESVTVLGAASASSVQVGGSATTNFTFDPTLEKLVVQGLSVDLNQGTTISWS